MARIAIEGDRLVVRLEGWERVWALKRRIEVPLASVTAVTVDPARARKPSGLRAPGTYWPGLITAGTYRTRTGKSFWSVRHPDKAVTIDLTNAPYTELVIEVADPDVVAADIRRALAT